MKNTNKANNLFIGNSITVKNGNLYNTAKAYATALINEINSNADNVRKVVVSSIKDNTLFVGMVEKKTGAKTIYAYKFSFDTGIVNVKIMNGNRYNNFFGIAVPKMIREF